MVGAGGKDVKGGEKKGGGKRKPGRGLEKSQPQHNVMVEKRDRANHQKDASPGWRYAQRNRSGPHLITEDGVSYHPPGKKLEGVKESPGTTEYLKKRIV